MINLFLSMALLIFFNLYKLYLLTKVPLIFKTQFSIMFYIYFINALLIMLNLFFLDSILFNKIPAFPYFENIKTNFLKKIKSQAILIFFVIYILLMQGKIPPAGNFYTDEITIFNNTALCDYYFIPNCVKKENSVTIPAKITIQYLSNNQKLLTFNYINSNTKKNERISIRLLAPELGWVVDSCYISRYFMNHVSSYFRSD